MRARHNDTSMLPFEVAGQRRVNQSLVYVMNTDRVFFRQVDWLQLDPVNLLITVLKH